MKIISPFQHRTVVDYSRAFDYEGENGRGFGFPCDEQGNLLPPTNPAYANPEAARNFAECLTGRVNGRNVVDRGIQRREYLSKQYAVGECCCGQRVTLYGFTNTCGCGADYNMSGQRLADRAFWGTDTGESLSDILMGDSDPWGGDDY